MLDMAYIRVLEVATFYYMFHLSPVGSVAHIQICGTTPCMLQGSEELLTWCQRNISPESHHPSPDGRFSWEEVECLGACANAPMAQIGKDYYEDLSAESLARIVQGLASGAVPQPGSQIGRFASEPQEALTSLQNYAGQGRMVHNASVELAMSLGDTVKRIDGTEAPLRAPWLRTPQPEELAPDSHRGDARPRRRPTARPARLRPTLTRSIRHGRPGCASRCPTAPRWRRSPKARR
jgi:NADH-quinone oxidoreductase subunit E